MEAVAQTPVGTLGLVAAFTIKQVQDERPSEAWPELADLQLETDRYGLRCVAATVSLLAARETSVADLEPLGAALDRLRSAPVLERHGIDALAPIRSRVQAFAEERQPLAGGEGASQAEDARQQVHTAAAVCWALHPEPATAAAQATYEALFAGCERPAIEARGSTGRGRAAPELRRAGVGSPPLIGRVTDYQRTLSARPSSRRRLLPPQSCE